MNNKIILTLFLIFFISCSSSISNVESLANSQKNLIFLKDNVSVEANQMNEKILFPIEKILIPKRSSLLPNALRPYRNGIHEVKNSVTRVQAISDPKTWLPG